jgi:hypothetical protein
LAHRRKGIARKLHMLKRLRRETTMALRRIAGLLNMAAAGSLTNPLPLAARRR